MRRTRQWLWLMAGWGMWVGLAQAAPSVVASVPPQAYVADRLVGVPGHTHVLIPSGSVEENYAPSPQQMKRLAEADLYFRVGHANFPVETGYINPLLRGKKPLVIDLLATPPAADTVASPAVTAEHKHHHDHGHAGGIAQDPHLWLSLVAMRDGAARLAQALTTLDPHHAAQYRTNLAAFLQDLDQLQRDMQAAMQPYHSRVVMAYHPAWRHLFEPLGLQQWALEAEGKTPSAVRLREVIRVARASGVRTLFAEKGFAHKAVERVANEVGANVVELDPLAYDWLANIRHVMTSVKQSYAK
jgi:zinc transport system substrate-binding protein